MSASSNSYKFEGWGAFAPDSIKGNLKWFEYEPKEFAEDDIDSECRGRRQHGT
jgi:alcohol dehydrogenase (NADP+)